jgi:membrane-associated phospholipid phosphatase
MDNKLARAISIIFQPLLIPTYGFIILFSLNTFFSLLINPSAKWMILGVVFLTTFLFPAVMIFFMMKLGVISSLNLRERQERVLPFLITGIFYYLVYYMLKQLQISPIYNYFMIGTTLVVVVAMVINFFWKISIHMISLGGVLGLFLGLTFVMMIDLTPLLILIIFISGLVGYSRLQLGAHTPAQVYTGFLTGFVVMLGLYIFI